MPAALCLMFIAMPIFAALSFELNTFVLFMALFCVVAGLSASDDMPADSSIEDRAEADQRIGEPRIDSRRQSPAERPNGPSAHHLDNAQRSLGFLRF